MQAQETARKAIRGTNSIINIVVLIVILMLLGFAGYALWDSKQLYASADKANYAIYKPTVENEGKSFQELQAINPEVFAWLTVYGTNIDYPVVQGKNNMKYVNTNAEGTYSLSGAIFLDCENSKDFSDFNSILYGHHMQKQVMFGEIDTFSDKNVFDSHRYGNLYFSGKNHGVEFFAFIHTSAYDSAMFDPGITQEEKKESYLNDLLKKAKHKRDIGITTKDHLILLSTCSSSSTNGRDILVGKITNRAYADPFLNTKTNDPKEHKLGVDSQDGFLSHMSNYLGIAILAILAALIILILVIINKRKNKSRR